MNDRQLNEEASVLDEIIAEYIAAEEADTAPDRHELMSDYPELADELDQFFRDRDRFKSMARPLNDAPAAMRELPERVRHFGDYELLEQIAHGGMGAVFKARQTTLNRIVAVKMILSAHLATDADIRRFKEEAATAARLRHKAIVRIHEVGVQNGQHYFSMDYIDGRNLSELLRTESFDDREIARLVRSVADAVDYAHCNGTVHRDIKPSNLLIDESGELHITDFGLALRVEGDSDLTRTGQIMGTPDYMSPEQAQALRGQIGPASDIYAIGAVLYEMLTGKPPFRGDSAVDTLRSVVETDPIPPRRTHGNVPLDLETICLKCLEKEPRKRYLSAAALSDDLSRYLAGEPILARPIGRAERASRWCRRNPVIASLSTLTLMLLVAVAAVASFGYVRESEMLESANELRKRAESGEREARDAVDQLQNVVTELQQKQEDNRQLASAVTNLQTQKAALFQELEDGERVLYENQLRLARSEWQAGNIVRADRYLEDCPPHLRRQDWFRLKRLWRPDMVDIEGRTCVAFSPNGIEMASAGSNHSIQISNAVSGAPVRQLTGHAKRVSSVAYSSDGRRIASASEDQTIRLWNAETGDLIRIYDDHTYPVTHVTFSPDGRHLASASTRNVRLRDLTRGEILVRDLETDTVVMKLPGFGRVTFSSDGRLMAARGTTDLSGKKAGTPVMTVWSLTGNPDDDCEPVMTIPSGESKLVPPVFSPHGNTLAVVAPRIPSAPDLETIQLWDLAVGQIQQELQAEMHVHSLAFSPDGLRLACGGRDGFSEAVSTKYQVVTFNLMTGQPDRVLPWYQKTIVDLAYDESGTSLATATPHAVRLWDVTPASDPTNAILDDIAELDVGKHDWPQWGGSRSRINTPFGKDIPTAWNTGEPFGYRYQNTRRGIVPRKSENVRWAVPLGSQTWGNPVVANGRIFVGTNNSAAYLPQLPSSVDLGVLLCFDEKTGDFLWQHSNDKLATGRVNDWPLQGVCSTPVVDGNRLWYVSNRGEIICLDTEGFHDGEDDGVARTVTDEWVRLFVKPRYLHGDFDRLRTELTRAGVEVPKYGRLREEKDPAHWTIGRWTRTGMKSHWRVYFDLRREGDQLRAYEWSDKEDAEPRLLFSLDDDQYEDLEENQINDNLRRQFKLLGVDIADSKLTPADGEKTWTLTGTMYGTSRPFELKVEGSNLRATRQLTLDDRDVADVVWRFDMMKKLHTSPHNISNCSMITVGDLLFVCTSTGVDESHVKLPNERAPSFVALNRKTGELVWKDSSPGTNIMHGQWSSPAYGVFDDQPQVIFPGGDGWVYAFDPKGDGKGGSRLLWKFDANPKETEWILGGRGTRNNIIAFPAIYDGLLYIVVGQDPEHGEGKGRIWCIDPAKRMDGSDVSAELAVDAEGNIIPHRRLQAVDSTRGEKAVSNPNSAVRWTFEKRDVNGNGEIEFEEEFHRSLSTPVIKDDIMYIPDFSGIFHCLNAKTGEYYWSYDLLAMTWGSALLVDGHVYIGDEDGDLAIFKHSADPNIAMKDGEPITTIEHDNCIYMTPIVANNVLYLSTRNTLYAIEKTPE